MDQIVDALRWSETAVLIWQSVIGIAIGYLFVLGLLCLFYRPAARAFLSGFAQTWLKNTVEAVLRFVVGLSVIALSSDTAYAATVAWCGVFLCVSAILMILLPGLHRKYAVWAVPFALRILPVFGVLSLAAAGAVAWIFFA